MMLFRAMYVLNTVAGTKQEKGREKIIDTLRHLSRAIEMRMIRNAFHFSSPSDHGSLQMQHFDSESIAFAIGLFVYMFRSSSFFV